MSGQQKNPLLKSNYSVKLDTKSSLLSTSTAIISKTPKTQEEKSLEKGLHVTHRLTRELSNKSKTVSTPSVKLVGTAPKLSDKYAISTNSNEKTTAGKISARTTTRPKIETLSKSVKPVALKSTTLQTKSLLLSATKSGLLTTKKPTTPPLTSSLKSSPRLSHLSTTGSKDVGRYSTSLLSSSYSAPSAVTSLKSSHIQTTRPVGKTTRSLVKSGSDAPAKQKHSHRQGAAGRDDTDDAAAPHYDLKLETTRSEREDEVETFVPPELDPSIHEPPLPTINIVQVIPNTIIVSIFDPKPGKKFIRHSILFTNIYTRGIFQIQILVKYF